MRFKDNQDREWVVEINVAVLRRLARDGINFHSLMENRFAKFLALQTDDLALADILWAVLRPQAEAAGVSQEEFDASLAGEATQRAWEAFSVEYQNFTRDPATRSALAEVLTRAKRVQERAAKTIQDKYEQMEKVAIARIDRMAAEMNETAMEKMLDESLPPPTRNEPSSISQVSSA